MRTTASAKWTGCAHVQAASHMPFSTLINGHSCEMTRQPRRRGARGPFSATTEPATLPDKAPGHFYGVKTIPLRYRRIMSDRTAECGRQHVAGNMLPAHQ